MAGETQPPRLKTEDLTPRDSIDEARPDTPMLPSPNGSSETGWPWLRKLRTDVEKGKSYAWLSTFSKFIGPGYLIAVGYIDPGNWATDLSAGSQARGRCIVIQV